MRNASIRFLLLATTLISFACARYNGHAPPGDGDTKALCGNGQIDSDETCDDGNTADGDYCSADCSSVTGSCGDEILQDNESCDDGNTVGGDYCGADCASVTGSCGDEILQDNESCDDGNTVGGDYCGADCASVTGSCGDQIVQDNESCDDGTGVFCQNSHDGGDGACVALTNCSSGYRLNGAGVCEPEPLGGLSTPCAHGQGWTLFRFHYDNGSTSARIDVWDASCSYSFASGSACNVVEVYPGFGSVSRTSEGYPIVTTSNYIRVRFDVTGLSFSGATLYLAGRSYATSSSTHFEAWSPLYGGIIAGPVDNDWTYDWYGVDWSNHLYPSDKPSLTAIQLYGSAPGSANLAVAAVELCVY